MAGSDNNRLHGVSIREIGIFGSEAKASVESTISDTGVFTKKTNNTGEAFSDILNDQYYNYVRNNGVSATASGVENSSTPISGAIDNDANTRWYDPSGDGTYYTVAVSYTHLDVYKRQGLEEGMVKGENIGQNRKLITQVCKKLTKKKPLSRIADELEEDITLIEKICNLIGDNPETVSYTHLMHVLIQESR